MQRPERTPWRNLKNKKVLNRKVRHQSKALLQDADYKRICRTGMMVDFT